MEMLLKYKFRKLLGILDFYFKKIIKLAVQIKKAI